MNTPPFVRRIILLLSILLLSSNTFAQFLDSAYYQLEFNGQGGNGNYSPFWLNANRHGVSSMQVNNGYLRQGVFLPDNRSKKIGYSFGLDIVEGYHYTPTVFVQQLYGEFRFSWAQLTVGSKEYEPEMKDRLLSSGGLTFSGNARPIPQIRLSIPHYIALSKNLFIKGHIAYGYYFDGQFQETFASKNSNKYVKNTIHHSKAGYLKWRSNDSKWQIEGGLEMATLFGGIVYNYGGNKQTIKLPQKLYDFFAAFLPLAGGEESLTMDQLNVAGNQLGSWLLSVQYKPGEWTIRPYYEHYFEDHSMMLFNYLWIDGLYGLEITLPKNPILATAVLEFTTTKDQSGSIFWDQTPQLPEQVSASDEYYNHSIYGWHYYGQGIGSPLAITPLYNKNHSMRFSNNRYNAWHVGLKGNPTPEFGYRLLATYSQNWGTYSLPFHEQTPNFSFFSEVNYTPKNWRGWIFSASFALDRGNLLGNNTAGSISIIKKGLFKEKF